MPLYDYLCPDCGPFDAMRSINQRDRAHCPACGLAAPLALLHAPHVSGMSAELRTAHAVNERAQHAPRSSRDGGYQRLRHPSGCGCCAPSARKSSDASASSSTSSATSSARMFPGRRPWMISH
ncbi:MAG: zinc ribbon domain-containing protein [Lautropia sp.]|nr:zinc ribbon domain-containing protein [Lautropia sp.]